MSEWGERAEGNRQFRTLTAVIEPCPPPAELPLIVADLRRSGAAIVATEQGGRLRHSDGCRAANHDLPGELRGVVIPSAAWICEATFYTMKRDPAVRVVDPEISLATHPGHRHLYPKSIVCPVFPPDRTWTWRQPVTDYVDQVAIWLLKTAVWIETGRRGNAIWVGDEVHVPPAVLLSRVGRNDFCPCASGEIYRRCCQTLHLDIVNGRRRITTL